MYVVDDDVDRVDVTGILYTTRVMQYISNGTEDILLCTDMAVTK